ncbi:hypothetical protein [Pseudomonas phage vB_PaeM_PAO1_Ab17]|uniref:Ead/Ea22-like family protein n=4 Tax=Nankokuvirus Ab03 TaxID=1925780 RepID=A0A0A1IWT0_9CAUD|nr:hypothetical protein VC54_gp023 [Pseudomonas phage vB_PaeM_PAO1_Ab03]CEF89128.1 hypothetical protein [Pseudomonas phage vB_PaeM_PAO1_Ab03]CEF89512.1 hypothetical protein [Pseudomonas phage vB_PaeM_PAO1_Ab17]CEQ38300.1 hypothetical protein [Pseudomonas phage vB_PaeM_PAO1_Ab04]CEQ38332.1 hypothetical protein [Pseudomonas phage vB_PaeM_PAO1_Ab06]
MTDHAKLRRLAKAATPGEWHAVWEEGDDAAWANLFPVIYAEGGETVIGNEGFYSDLDQDKANAQFCAAANPKTLLALLDEIGTLREEVLALREKVGVAPTRLTDGDSIGSMLREIGYAGEVSYHHAREIWNACIDEQERLSSLMVSEQEGGNDVSNHQ